MPRLLIIADDLTGALDTGVKFSEAGLSTIVSTRWQDAPAPDADIAVLCADTRHLPSEQAYRVIRTIVEQNRKDFAFIMKKTDSGLRGNIGAELQGVMDGAEEKLLAFLPALPEMNRVTRGGVQYIDGVPVSRSVFGCDPFEQVLDDDIPCLLRRQCSIPTQVIARGEVDSLPAESAPSIRIYDAETADDMRRAVSRILGDGRVHLLAGCAGLAQALAAELSPAAPSCTAPSEKAPLLIVCGSVNHISRTQLDYAEKKGFLRFHLPPEYLLADTPDNAAVEEILDQCASSVPVMADTFFPGVSQDGVGAQALEERRQQIAARLGALIKAAMDRGVERRILIIGGDTLLSLMEALGCTMLTPVCEPERGVVLSVVEYGSRRYQILSKSGGFGAGDLLLKL